jgi:hypothetical protein
VVEWVGGIEGEREGEGEREREREREREVQPITPGSCEI